MPRILPTAPFLGPVVFPTKDPRTIVVRRIYNKLNVTNDAYVTSMIETLKATYPDWDKRQRSVTITEDRRLLLRGDGIDDDTLTRLLDAAGFIVTSVKDTTKEVTVYAISKDTGANVIFTSD